MEGNSSLGDKEDERDAVQFVKNLLRRSLWVQVDDTRWIYGEFVCLDHLKNLILENSFQVTCEGHPRGRDVEKRQRLDCCIIPGEKIRKIFMEESS
ncbi:hypothetical protein Gasu2_51120 [Galdieria sulphuraria]|uniref:Sm domain-containing protein n=1 Tax=Galdieria sulphuraria TaxID=130081 RepID=M2Y4T3_GALSU|nr:uncharacterized protein Gasu_17410 [Galdieria sulphuraria]EME30978.1 hypothetical protein Gasu_17410 [Galdieria sulphuraria]GJD10950.1 hypothetical protein Gasu2_51120 [Galdieria sulphuraria]|eukprot:XP_005707498.1 hypothetical protein Gasu_17410 [Galdieria sulphuraria]